MKKTLEQIKKEGSMVTETQTPAAKPVEAPVTPKAPAAPKTTLRDQAVGVKDGNQTLREKKSGGNVQLWEGKVGWGVVRIVKNHYEVVLPCRSPEATARSIFAQTS